MISPNIPLCDLASLNWVSHRVPSSPAYARKRKGKELLATELDTHTTPNPAPMLQAATVFVVVGFFKKRSQSLAACPLRT